MKIRKKVTAGFIGATMFLGMCAGAAYAGVWCNDATITQAGINPDIVHENRSKYVIFADCGTDSIWPDARRFYLTPDLGEAGYATALTAMSLDQTVKMKVANTLANSLVLQIQLNP